MNTIGVLLSASCLGVSLFELWKRSDLAGRRIGALAAVVAWLTMGTVAMDQHSQYDLLIRRHAELHVPAVSQQDISQPGSDDVTQR